MNKYIREFLENILWVQIVIISAVSVFIWIPISLAPEQCVIITWEEIFNTFMGFLVLNVVVNVINIIMPKIIPKTHFIKSAKITNPLTIKIINNIVLVCLILGVLGLIYVILAQYFCW